MEEDILGKAIDWDHHRIDEIIVRRNQNKIGARSQFSGLRWGIRIILELSNSGLTSLYYKLTNNSN